MITNPAAKHNRLFQTALAIVKEEVPLGPRKDMPGAPGSRPSFGR